MIVLTPNMKLSIRLYININTPYPKSINTSILIMKFTNLCNLTKPQVCMKLCTSILLSITIQIHIIMVQSHI